MRSLYFAIIFLITFISCKPNEKKIPTPYELKLTELHGHRGCRGLYPENSLPAFINALKFGVDVLEMDVCVSKDNQVFVSHEPFYNPEICDGDSDLNLYNLNYSEIRKSDCGMKEHPRFPEQQKIKVYKPLLIEVIDSVERFCKRQNIKPPKFNIELKSEPNKYKYSQPEPKLFCMLVHNVLKGSGIYSRTIIQSFDPEILKAYKKINPFVKLSLLVENDLSLIAHLKKAGLIPNIFSPYYKMVNKSVVDSCHLMGMEIIPWTVNDTAEALRLL
jgi:glycerophosphoryl diester phosphodiesterase